MGEQYNRARECLKHAPEAQPFLKHSMWQGQDCKADRCPFYVVVDTDLRLVQSVMGNHLRILEQHEAQSEDCFGEAALKTGRSNHGDREARGRVTS